MTEAEYRRHIETLASDAFGGRYPATPGEDLTVAYLIDQFRALGLAPGNGDSYTQDVPLMRIEAVNSPELTFRGADGDALVLAYGPDQVIWTRRQVPGAALEASELVSVGYGINAPERGWNDYELPLVDSRGRQLSLDEADRHFTPVIPPEKLGRPLPSSAGQRGSAKMPRGRNPPVGFRGSPVPRYAK